MRPRATSEHVSDGHRLRDGGFTRSGLFMRHFNPAGQVYL